MCCAVKDSVKFPFPRWLFITLINMIQHVNETFLEFEEKEWHGHANVRLEYLANSKHKIANNLICWNLPWKQDDMSSRWTISFLMPSVRGKETPTSADSQMWNSRSAGIITCHVECQSYQKRSTPSSASRAGDKTRRREDTCADTTVPANYRHEARSQSFRNSFWPQTDNTALMLHINTPSPNTGGAETDLSRGLRRAKATLQRKHTYTHARTDSYKPAKADSRGCNYSGCSAKGELCNTKDRTPYSKHTHTDIRIGCFTTATAVITTKDGADKCRYEQRRTLTNTQTYNYMST